MSEGEPVAPPRAVLDACVLYPAPLRDLFLHLAVAGAYQARWSDDIHEEWMRNVLENRPDLTRQRLERTRALMDAHAADCLVTGYEDRIAGLSLPDPDDRHVLAAAIQSLASVIVTANRKDFPSAVLAQHGVTVKSPDDFLCELTVRDDEAVVEAVRNQRAMLKNPPKTVEELFATFEQNGLTHFVASLRPYADEL